LNPRASCRKEALPLLLLHLLICIVLSARERSLRWEPRPHGAAAGSLEVPHIIHQMYKTLDLPAKWAGVPGQWARLHPPSEYTYILWTDESLRELIATDYEWLLPTYDAYPHPTQRWDASRYAVLHKYGGLYADLDLHPIASVDGLLRRQTLLLPHTPNIGLTNALLAATPRHPFLAFALQQLPAYASKWYHVTKHWAVLSSTGSTYIWAMHMRWAREHAGSSAASLVPSADWGKCSYCDGAQVGAHRDLGNPPPASPASPDDRDSGWISPLAHGQGSSWHSGDSRVVLFAFCHVHEAVALAVVWLTWRHTRKLRPTLCASLCLVLIVAVQRLLGLLLLETFLGRPLVWLLMS